VCGIDAPRHRNQTVAHFNWQCHIGVAIGMIGLGQRPIGLPVLFPGSPCARPSTASAASAAWPRPPQSDQRAALAPRPGGAPLPLLRACSIPAPIPALGRFWPWPGFVATQVPHRPWPPPPSGKGRAPGGSAQNMLPARQKVGALQHPRPRTLGPRGQTVA